MTSLAILHKNMEVGRITKRGEAIPNLPHDLIYFKCFCDYRFETHYKSIKDFYIVVNEHLSIKHDKNSLTKNISENLVQKLCPDLKIEELDYI